jgi:hypothetical protein
MEIYFKINNTADIIINGKLAASYRYSSDKWIPVKINLSGRSQRIYVQIEGKTEFRISWKFPMDIARIENFEITGEKSPNYPSDGYPLFYIDDFTIREVPAVSTIPVTVGKSGIQIFPNPVRDELWIDGLYGPGTTSIYIINSLGQVMKEIILENMNAPINVNLTDLKPGIYWLHCRNNETTETLRIVKTR